MRTAITELAGVDDRQFPFVSSSHELTCTAFASIPDDYRALMACTNSAAIQ